MTTFDLIKSDLYRYKGEASKRFSVFLFEFFYNRGFIYSFWYRLSRSKYTVVSLPSKFILKLKSWKYNIEISPKVEIGCGLYIGHGGNIIINPTATLGDNVNISQFCTIGANEGNAATIGNNVYIGPSVCIVENVIIGDNVTVGAGAVVVKNIEPNATAVGVPAKAVNFDNPALYIKNPYIFRLK